MPRAKTKAVKRKTVEVKGETFYLGCCPSCKGWNFAEFRPHKNNRGETWMHTKCLDCGTVQWLTYTRQFSENGYCANPEEHYAG
jgi:hypothetical protein